MLVIAMALAIMVGLAAQSQAWAFLCDDAFISFRYADRLAEHGELVFNLGERVEGYSNFAWVVLLAALAGLGIPPHESAPALTFAAAGGGLVAVTFLFRSLRGRKDGWAPTDLVPAAVLAAWPEYAVWSSGGLETAAAAALVLGAIAAWLGRRLITAAALTAAAALCRPDALLPIGVFGLAWLGIAYSRGQRSIPWRKVGIAAAVFVVPVGAHLLWRHSYYGSWLPNTWTVKAHGRLLRDSYGIAYVGAWVDAVFLVYLAPLVLLLRARHLVVVLPIAAQVGYGWWVGGDFMAYSRFYVVATAMLAILVAWLLCDAASLAQRRRPHRGWAQAPLTIGLGLTLLGAGASRARLVEDREAGVKWLDGMWEGVTAMDRFARVGFAVGSWMGENLPPDTLISVGAAGAVPYASRLPAVDSYGLIDPKVATLPKSGPHSGKGARPGHQLFAPASYMKSRDPDLLCHVGMRAKKPPTERQAHPAFRREYRWACIEPQSIEPGFDSGYYCCRRPRDRVVGPFGGTP